MNAKHYLLDTHCLLWFQDNNPNISDKALRIIEDPENIIFFSQVSLFEITIKQKIGKLPLFRVTVQEIFEQAVQDGFQFLNLHNQHILIIIIFPLTNLTVIRLTGYL